MEVRDLKMTSDDRPSQWQGRVGENGSVYIRYRWGHLEVYLSEASRDPLSAGACIYDEQVGGEYDGQMSTAQMVAALAGVCRFKGANG